jgi:hypothetical protein
MRGTLKLIVTGLLPVCVMGMLAVGADAQRRGKRAPKVPHSAAIGDAMEGLEWGMSKDDLMRHFIRKVHEDYKPKFAKVTDAIQEDRLRHKLREDIKKIRESYVEFNGRTTGWDVSFLRNEFTHRNGESVVVVNDDQAQNFYFLINNKFWKWYRAFNSEVFAGSSFDQFAEALQGRFGRAVRREGVMTEGAEERRWLEWQDRATRLRAVDNTAFYGFYCLVFEDKNMLGRIDKLRVHKRPSGERSHGIVDAVTSGADEPANPDRHEDVVDRITKKKKRSQ